MFFDGDFKTRRPINLGGRNTTPTSSTLSRADFLRKAEEERQKREQSRRRLEAALRIQSFFRSVLKLRSWANCERQLWMSKVREYEKNPVAFPPEVWLSLCRSLVFFFKTPWDSEKLCLLIQRVDLPSLNSQLQDHPCLFRRLVSHIFFSLERIPLEHHLGLISFTPFISKSYPGVVQNPTLMIPFEAYLRSLVPSALKLAEAPPNTSILSALAPLVLLMASTHPLSFLKRIFPIAGLLDLFSQASFQYARYGFPLADILHAVKEMGLTVLDPLPPVDAPAFVHNFIHLTSYQLSINPTVFALPYFKILSHVFKLVPDIDVSPLKDMLKQDHFAFILNTIPHVPEEALYVFCDILSIFLRHLPLSRSSIVLLSDPKLPRAVYYQCINEKKTQATLPTLIKDESYMSTLYVLSDLIYRSISTIADPDFNEFALLPIPDLMNFISHLKSIVFNILYHSFQVNFNSLKTMTLLLRELSSKKSFNEICGSSKFWLVSDFNPDQFFAQALEDYPPDFDTDEPLSPRYRLLTEIPFVFPFQLRVRIFRGYIALDRTNSSTSGMGSDFRFEIRRDHLFQDSFQKLKKLGSILKKKISIVFVNEFGVTEEGIDGGGVFKEYLNELAKIAFHPSFNLFEMNRNNELYPSINGSNQLKYYEFLGMMMGKALYEKVLLEPVFAPFFINKWIGKQNFLDDLLYLDPDLYKNLLFLKKYEHVETLSLNFSITYEERGQIKTVELIPNGRNIPVDNTNKIKYIYLVADYKLNLLIQGQSNAFLAGMAKLVEPKWLAMFKQEELGMLLSGSSITIDLEDMKKNTVYSGGYFEEHPVILSFWKVASEMSDEDKRLLLHFITSCTRAPLLGFKELNPLICIRSAGDDQERLPTSSTCINLLKLPEFQTEEVLRKKLLYSIHSKAGFELS